MIKALASVENMVASQRIERILGGRPNHINGPAALRDAGPRGSAAVTAFGLRGLASNPAHGIFLIAQVEELYVPKRSPLLSAAHFRWHGE